MKLPQKYAVLIVILKEFLYFNDVCRLVGVELDFLPDHKRFIEPHLEYNDAIVIKNKDRLIIYEFNIFNHHLLIENIHVFFILNLLQTDVVSKYGKIIVYQRVI